MIEREETERRHGWTISYAPRDGMTESETDNQTEVQTRR